MILSKVFRDSYEDAREYSELLRDILTNDKERVSKHIRQIHSKEDDVAFERRKEYTYFDNISLYNPIYSNVYKTKHKISSVSLKDPDSLFSKYVNDFYKDGSLVDFIYNELLERILLNPNSILYLKNSDSEDGLFSHTFINEDNITYLELDDCERVVSLTASFDGGRFHYSDGKVTEFIQIESSEVVQNVPLSYTDKDQEFEFEDGGKYSVEGVKYQVYISEMNVNPFIFLGYKWQEDFYRSFVDNLIPYAIFYASMTSESQLTAIRHGYPKTAVIAPDCDNPSCNSGYVDINRKTKCSECGGTGRLPISESGYDVTVWSVEALTNEVTNNVMSLDDVYKEFPSSLEYLRWQEEKLQNIREQSFSSIFYNTVKEDNASGMQLSWRSIVMKKESENEALIPFANFLIRLSKQIIETASSLVGSKEFGQIVFYPKLVDLSLAELAEIIKELREVGADERLVTYYENKLNEASFGLDSSEFIIKQIKSDIIPFKGLTNEEVLLLVSNGLARKIDLFLYFNFDNIINQLDKSLFFKGNEDRIKLLIDQKLQELYSEIGQDTSNRLEFNVPNVEEEE